MHFVSRDGKLCSSDRRPEICNYATSDTYKRWNWCSWPESTTLRHTSNYFARVCMLTNNAKAVWGTTPALRSHCTHLEDCLPEHVTHSAERCGVFQWFNIRDRCAPPPASIVSHHSLSPSGWTNVEYMLEACSLFHVWVSGVLICLRDFLDYDAL